MHISRRNALKGGTATVAAIAAGGAVAARLAVDDAAIEAAAKVYWSARSQYEAVLDIPEHTDEQADAFYWPRMAAYDAVMELPAHSLNDLQTKVRAYRIERFHHVGDYMPDEDLDVLLSDIERLAGEARS